MKNRVWKLEIGSCKWFLVLLFIFYFLPFTCLNATSISENAGTTTGEFLRIGAGARVAGMGEAFASVADDVYSLYWNPGGLSKVTQKQTLLAHTFWYESVSHEYAAYVHPLSADKGTVGISVTYLGTTFEKRAGDTAEPDSNASVGDMAIGLSYGRKTYYDINTGITLKYINSKLDTESSTAFGVDLGLQRVCPLWEKMDIGLAISNIGGSLKYIDDSVAIGKTLDKRFLQDRGLKEWEKDYTIQTPDDIIDSLGNILLVVQAILVGIASISLIVGGIGIMNTMYTAVLERTGEIGIIKSIGARNSTVLLIFLFESGMLGLVGGLIGLLLGVILSLTVQFFGTLYFGTQLLNASFPTYLMIGALLFSFSVGSFAGTFPAVRASRLKPVDALRYRK